MALDLFFFKRLMQRRKKFDDSSCLEKNTPISTQRQKTGAIQQKRLKQPSSLRIYGVQANGLQE